MKKPLLLLCALSVGAYSLVPFLWFVLTSWKSPAQITAIPPEIVPAFHWVFYRSALKSYGLLGYVRNSLIVAGVTTCLSIAIGALAAYALTRFHSGWLRLYLLLLLSVSMFPQIALAGPVWRLLDSLGWLNTYQGIIAAHISLPLPLSIWVLGPVFTEMPYPVED